MVRVDVDDLCQSISVSIANVRMLLRSRGQVPDILDCFWSIQDRLARLVDAASDCPFEVFRPLKEEHPQLLRDVICLLGTASRGSFVRNAAIASSCEAVNQLLIKLEALKPLSRSQTAGA
jgi:hypothetical protein